MKYSKEFLENIIKTSDSIEDILTKLNKRDTRDTRRHLYDLLKINNIEFSYKKHRTKKNIKYSKELLEPIVKNSKSTSDVVRSLNKKVGGFNGYIKHLLIKFNIDFTHFSQESYNKGKSAVNRKTADQILILLPEKSNKEKTYKLKRSMIEIGIEYKCLLCGLKNIWNNKKIVLEIDHINGNPIDNRRENLRFLCPNCHSQTSTYKSKNIPKNINII